MAIAFVPDEIGDMRMRRTNPSRHSARNRPLRPIVLLVLGAIALTVALTNTVATPAADQAGQQVAASSPDPHDYPRTYHLYGYGPLDELARYDMVVGLSFFDVAGLRSRNPSGIFLLNPALTAPDGSRHAIHVTAPGGAGMVWPGGTDDQPGPVNLGSIRAVDQAWDLLRNANGSLAGIGGKTLIKGWNLADPRGKGTPGLVSKLFAYAAKKDGLYTTAWDGVHSDNWAYAQVDSNWYFGPNLDTDRNGVVDDRATLHRNWANGLTSVGNNLRAYLPGKIVGGNGAWYRPQDYAGSDPEGWLKASNYTVVEHMQNFAYETPDDFLALTRRWLDYPDPLSQPRYMAAYEEALDASGEPLPASSNPNDPAIMLRADVMRSMRWGLTLSLMTDVYYGIALGGKHNTRWWYDEFDGGDGIRRRGYLGQPLGGPIVLANGLYRREFANGIVLNNSSSGTQTIQLGGTFKKLRGSQNPTLNDGASVTSVTIPAHDGIILLRTGSATPPPPPPAAPPPPAPSANLALGKPAAASSIESAELSAAEGNDGSSTTRWASAERDGEWWQVDLGSTMTVAGVTIDWETAYAAEYLVQTSLNGTSFTTAATVTSTGPGSKATSFAATSARYVRILAVTRGTNWGVSFWEAQVFGAATAPASAAPESTALPASGGGNEVTPSSPSPTTADDRDPEPRRARSSPRTRAGTLPRGRPLD
jgi:hypothetical protein